jgi:hypothetical protein
MPLYGGGFLLKSFMDVIRVPIDTIFSAPGRGHRAEAHPKEAVTAQLGGLM